MQKMTRILTIALIGCLSSCFSGVQTIRCIPKVNNNGVITRLRCHDYDITRQTIGRTSPSTTYKGRFLNGAVCVPADEWPKVFGKLTEARDYWLDKEGQ